MPGMSGFRNFLLRGNLVDLAVAVVIGAQFSGLVKQFVNSFISPLLAEGPGRHRAGLPPMHDEHPARGPALPGVHRGNRARHRAAAGRHRALAGWMGG